MTAKQRLAHLAIGGVVAVAAMLASTVVQTGAQSAGDVINAREIRLVDEAGQTQIRLAGMNRGGLQGLEIKTAQGDPFAMIARKDGTSSVFLLQHNRKAPKIIMNSELGKATQIIGDGKGDVFIMSEGNRGSIMTFYGGNPTGYLGAK